MNEKIIISARAFNDLVLNGIIDSRYVINVMISEENELLLNEIKKMRLQIEELKEELKREREAVDFVNETAPPMYEYNEIELRMILKVRETQNLREVKLD